MSSRRPPADRTDAAARRLAELAVGLGAAPGALRDPVGSAAGDQDEWWADHTRVAAPLELDATHPPVPAPLAPEAPLIPVPGRHAARRRLVLPAPDLRGRLPVLSPVHVALVALAVAVGLAVTTWWVVRDDPGPAVEPVSAEPLAPLVEPSALGSRSPSDEVSPAGAAAPVGSTTTVTVDVTGKVRRPGIVVLDQGARVTDALSAAGGAKRGVDLSTLNLARVLVDGEQIVVGARSTGAAPAPAPAAGGDAAGAPATPVNLNLAGQAELESLPGVGPVTAQAILAWRDQQGGFTSVDELLEVDGIGEKTLARLAPHVTV
jgi:competence protein ComEA